MSVIVLDLLIRPSERGTDLRRVVSFDADVPLSFGSDYPGEKTYAPLYGMHLAVNRPEGLSITPEESKGRLKEGFLADLTILDANPLKTDPKEIKNIKVLETIMGWRTVFRL